MTFVMRNSVLTLLSSLLLLLAACSQPAAQQPLPSESEVAALEAALFPQNNVTATSNCVPMQTLVPLYIYPSRVGLVSWRAISNLNKLTPVTAIISPASGPGGPPNADYQSGMSLLQAGGVRMAGYIHTDYGSRGLASVKADINTYHQYFSLSGFFIDTVNNTLDTLNYYTELYSYIKSLNPNYRVILNPGTVINEAYLSAPAGDVVIVSEDYYSRWLSYPTPSYVSNYQPAQLGAIVHSTGSTTRLLNAMQLARKRNIGWFYATSLTMPDPWKRLPSVTFLNAMGRYLGCSAQR